MGRRQIENMPAKSAKSRAHIVGDAAGQRNHRNAAALRPTPHAAGPLVAQALLVEEAFGSNDQSAPTSAWSKPTVSSTRSMPGSSVATEHAIQARCHAAGGSARNHASHVAAGQLGNHICKVLEVALELEHRVRARAFLRTEHARRAVRPEERAVYVASDAEFCPR